MTGPRIGPTITPMPHTDMALACLDGGLMSIITVWLSGFMNAAATPCITRNATIAGRLVAKPHSMDAATKPTMLTRNSLRLPSRSASQPVIGMATAEATM